MEGRSATPARIGKLVVFEILSPGNRLKEMTKKFKFYDDYGVEEYYLSDPDVRISQAGFAQTAGLK